MTSNDPLVLNKIKRPTNSKIHWSLNKKFIGFTFNIEYKFKE
ncbi:hypothetical protein ABH962_001342 [Bacillus sp. RC54]